MRRCCSIKLDSRSVPPSRVLSLISPLERDSPINIKVHHARTKLTCNRSSFPLHPPCTARQRTSGTPDGVVTTPFPTSSLTRTSYLMTPPAISTAALVALLYACLLTAAPLTAAAVHTTSDQPPGRNECTKANAEMTCDKTIYCMAAAWPELLPDDGWNSTTLRNETTGGGYFIDIAWRFISEDDLVEFAISYGSCSMPHIRVGFPADESRNDVPCTDHQHVDIEQITSTKSNERAHTNPDLYPWGWDKHGLGTIRIAEFDTGFCDKGTHTMPTPTSNTTRKHSGPISEGRPLYEQANLAPCSATCDQSSKQQGVRVMFTRPSSTVVKGKAFKHMY